MGYEITIKYHKKIEPNSFQFDTENFETRTFKVGRKNENISRSQLAKSLIKQLSRRDVLVSDINVIEYVKQEIKVRPTNNGIIIGNKKYILDDVLNSEDIELIEEVMEQQNQIQQQNVVQFVPQNINNIIKYSYFCPQPHEMKLKDQFSNMGVTINKKYAVLKEDIYRGYLTIINDFDKQSTIPDRFFQDSDPNILQKELAGESEGMIDLKIENQFNDNMPVIRR